VILGRLILELGEDTLFESLVGSRDISLKGTFDLLKSHQFTWCLVIAIANFGIQISNILLLN
jgi:hypothetical protein